MDLETKLLEEYNKEVNERLSKRPVGDLITCNCQEIITRTEWGRWQWIKYWVDVYDYRFCRWVFELVNYRREYTKLNDRICKKCKGTGYRRTSNG